MSCGINSGISVSCDDLRKVGGLNKRLFLLNMKDLVSVVFQNGFIDEINLKEETFIYEFISRKLSHEAGYDIEKLPGGNARFTHAVTIKTLTRTPTEDDILNNLYAQRYGVIVETNNKEFVFYGLVNGLKLKSIEQNTGTVFSEDIFDVIELEGKEKRKPAQILVNDSYSETKEYLFSLTKLPPPSFTAIFDTNINSDGNKTLNFDDSVDGLTLAAGDTIDWGDGNEDSNTSHTYSTAGEYTVQVKKKSGDINWSFDNETNGGTYLKEITNWGRNYEGTNGFVIYTEKMFKDTPVDLSAVADVPLITASSFREMFRSADVITTINRSDEWDISSVTEMDFFANGAFNFNADISNWDVSEVTDMTRLCTASNFNQDIGGWDVSKVESFSLAFRNTPFNQDIGSWDVSSVTDMSRMFEKTPFNQDIGNWDVSSVTDMSRMFFNANSFDQDISDWVFTALTDASNMFAGGGGLSTINYDALLIALDNTCPNNNVPFHGGDSQYTIGGAAETARNNLISRGWIITDGGGI